MNFIGLYFVLAQEELVHEGAKTLSFTDILHSNVLNFLFMIVFLVWLSKKFNIFSYIIEKQNLIKQEIENTEKEKAGSILNFNEVQEQVEKLDDEVQKIGQEANKIAKSLYANILKEAHTEANEMMKKAEKTIKAEREKALNEVTKDISKVAFLAAEEQIKQAIDEKFHKKYIDEFMDNLTNLKV
ncbi:MAG: ATP synthase F0 subunit B [bacterium]